MAMRRAGRLVIVAGCAAGSAAPAFTQTYTWTGASNNVWTTGANWMPGTGCPTCVPGLGGLAGANAIVPEGGSTVVSQPGNRLVLGTLNVGASTAPQQFRLQLGGPGFEVNFASLRDTLVANGIAHGPVEFRGRCAWSGGTLSGEGTLGILEGEFSIINATLQTAGLFNAAEIVQNGSMVVGDTAIGNSGAWRFDLSGFIGSLGGPSAGVLTNAGRLGRWAPSVNTTNALAMPLDNAGTLDCSIGRFDLNHRSTHHNAQWLVSENGEMRLTSSAANPLTISGPVTATVSDNGVLRLQGVNATIESPQVLTVSTSGNGRFIESATPLVLGLSAKVESSGVCELSGRIEGQGRFVNLAGGRMSTSAVELAQGALLVNSGRFDLTGFIGLNAGGVDILAGSEFYMTGSQLGTLGGAAGSVVCQGRMIGTSPTNVMRARLLLGIGGRLEVNSGGFTMIGGCSSLSTPTQVPVIAISSAGVVTIPVGSSLTSRTDQRDQDHAGLLVEGEGEMLLQGIIDAEQDQIRFVFGDEGRLRITGGTIRGPGTILLQGGQSIWDHGTLEARFFNLATTVFNSGTIAMPNGSRFVSGGPVVQHAAAIDQTRSVNSLEPSIYNGGEWTIDGPSSITLRDWARMQNQDTIIKTSTHSALIQGRLAQAGHVDVRQGTLTISGPLTDIQGIALGPDLAIGTWSVSAGARLNLPGNVTLTTIGANARVTLGADMAATAPALQNVQVNFGDFTLSGAQAASTLFGALSNAGRITTEGSASLGTSGSLSNMPGGRLQTRSGDEAGPGGGYICSTLVNEGEIVPGGDEATRDFPLMGDLACEASSIIAIEIAGPMPAEQYDQVNVTGEASLDGVLRISLLDDHIPPLGQTFTILEATYGLVGRFQLLDQSALPSNIRFRIEYGPAAATLIRTCGADMTGSSDPADPAYGFSDGILDIADFFYFLDRFVLADLAEGDLSGSSDPLDPAYGQPDGVLDLSDFFYFLDLFVSGCG